MIKDNKKKEAIKRKLKEEENLNKLGLSLDSDLFSLGIVFDNFLSSPFNIFAINQINNIFNNFVGVDISVFAHQIDKPCLFLMSPILDLKFLFNWTSPIIVTSTSTTKSALNSYSQKIYYYLFDDSSYNSLKENINIIKDSRINLICGLVKHQIILKEKFNIDSKLIENFDLIKIVKIINEDLKK